MCEYGEFLVKFVLEVTIYSHSQSIFCAIPWKKLTQRALSLVKFLYIVYQWWTMSFGFI